jgi:dienelactone hydrolase
VRTAAGLRVGMFAFLLVVPFALGPFAGARAEGIRTDLLQIPAVISGQTYQLEAIVVRPDDAAPHPLAVLNHGSPRDVADRRKASPFRTWAQAREFARRGWTAVAFLRRGYGNSQGEADRYGACSNPDYAGAGRTSASEIAAVAAYMREQPFVAKGNWISVGFSAGAFASIALSADLPPGLAAVIAFAPGRGSRDVDDVCTPSRLVAALAEYGRTSRIPVLWVSAPNDQFFEPKLVSDMTAAFSKAGGHLTFVAAPSFGEDGHQLFSTASGIPIWTPILDRFLAANKLVLRDRPIDIAIPDVPPPPALRERGRAAFKAYLASGPNKAFAMGGTRFGWVSGRRSIADASKDALALCRSDGATSCAVVNANDEPAR